MVMVCFEGSADALFLVMFDLVFVNFLKNFLFFLCSTVGYKTVSS